MTRMWCVFLFGVLAASGATAQPDPKADSLATLLYESAGGAATWAQVPYIKFNYTHAIGQTTARTIRHLWNRQTNEYRVELPGPTNEPYVVLIDLDTRQGRAYWNGSELSAQETEAKAEEAYRRYVHDTFWLLTPLKLFDPGAERTYVSDSSTAITDVLKVRYSLPGYAPAEEYWLYVDKASGLITRGQYWGPHDARTLPPREFVWRGYERHWTGIGYVYLSTEKSAADRPHSILTNQVEFPVSVAEDMFTVGDPRLSPPAPEVN